MAKTFEEIVAERTAAIEARNGTTPTEKVEEKPKEAEKEEEKPESKPEEKPESKVEEGNEDGKENEGSEEEEEKDRNSFIESLKEVTPEKKEEQKEVVVSDELQKKYDALLAELEEKNQKLSVLEEDPFLKAAQMGATPAEIRKIAKEIANADISDKPVEDLIQMAVKANFPELEGEDLEAIVERERTDFENLSPLAQKQREKELRGEFEKAGLGSETLNKLQDAYLKKQESMPKPGEEDANIQKIVNHEKGLLEQTGKKLLGKKMFGVEFTQEKLDSIINDYSLTKAEGFLNEKGELDAARMIQQEFTMRNMDLMIENEVEARLKQRMKGQYVEKGKESPNSTIVKTSESDDEKRLRGLGFPEHFIQATLKNKQSK